MEPSSYSYVVTANRPTAVSHALTCSLYGELPSLVVAKGTRLEVHLVARDDGPTLVHDVALHGRVASLSAFRPATCAHDRLLLLTASRRYAILGFDGERFVTHASGDLSDPIGRARDAGPVGLVEPGAARIIAAHLYDGLLKVVPLDARTGALGATPFSARLDELHVVDIVCLHAPPGAAPGEFARPPTIAVLYEDAREARHVKT